MLKLIIMHAFVFQMRKALLYFFLFLQIISENTEEITSTIQNQKVSQPTLPEEKTPTKHRRVFLTTPKTRKAK